MQMELQWTSYVAIVTGGIGAITGIAGSTMGYIAYRRSNQIKKSDRRLDLHSRRNDIESAYNELLDILPRAREAHRSITHPPGVSSSPKMDRFDTQLQQDGAVAGRMNVQLRSEGDDYSSMSLQELEDVLVRLDRIKHQLDSLVTKYRASIQEDQQRGRELRALTLGHT